MADLERPNRSSAGGVGGPRVEDPVVDPDRHEPVRAGALLAEGWARVLGEAAVVLAAVAALGAILGLLLAGSGWVRGASFVDGLRYGWLLVYVYHHAGVEVQTPALHLPARADVVAGLPTGFSTDATVAVCLMGGAAVAGFLLYRAGRRLGSARGGTGIVRAFTGAKVAVPYAIVLWAASWPLRFGLRPEGASPMAVHPSHIATFFWPLGFGLVAGFAGGLGSAGDAVWTSDWWQSDNWNRRLRGALAGGWRMVVVAFAAAVLALAGLAVARPHDAAAYFHTVRSQGPGGAASVLVLSAMALPNMAVWLIEPAMGGCLEVNGSGVFRPYCFLSYGSFAGHQVPGASAISGFPALGGAPAAFALFALIPLGAVLVGGMTAARKGSARSRGEAAAIGALAGVVFALWFVLAMALATISARLNGPLFIVSTGFWRYGPNPATGLQLALAWGVLGGLVGGWLSGPARDLPKTM